MNAALLPHPPAASISAIAGAACALLRSLYACAARESTMPFTATPQGFVAMWRHATLPERSPAQEHCIGLCDLTARPTLDQFNRIPVGSTSVLACGTPPRAGLGRRSEAWLLRLGTQGQTRCLAEALQNRFIRWGCCSFSALGRTSHATLILQRDSGVQDFRPYFCANARHFYSLVQTEAISNQF